VTEEYANFWWQARRPDPSAPGTGTSRLASVARALGYRTRIRALDLAENNSLVDKAAVKYLRRR
jgi:hypothetical protein